MITITPQAATKLLDHLEDEEGPRPSLRIFVTKGGCEGFSYGMQFDTESHEGDRVFTQHGLNVVMDPIALGVMSGAQIDFRDGPMGAGFTVHNPRAVSTCGCGHSFKTAEDAGTAEPCAEDEVPAGQRTHA